MKGRVIYSKPIRYEIDGNEVTEAEFRKAFPPKGAALIGLGIVPETVNKTSKCWPRLSDSMGVSKKQIKAAYEASVKQGVPTEFAPDGRAIIRDNAHQRDLQKALGVINKSAGYGEVTG